MIEIVVVEDVWGPALAQLAGRRTVARRPHAWDAADLPALLHGARALVVRNKTQVTRELLESVPSLQLVARAGVGLDNIDVAAADELGVVVVAPLGANAVSVAEHALGLALALARHIVALDRDTRGGGWTRRAGRELAGGIWGLLGAGATGQACARLARGIGMHVLAYDPYMAADHPALAELEIELADLSRVAAKSDVLSCHLPVTDATRGFVGRELLAQMRPDALLINVGRGEVVDEDALADALHGGCIGGAGLDVRATEPPSRGRLEALDNVVLTPHVAGITSDSQARITEVLAHDIERVLDGGEALSAVGGRRAPTDTRTLA